MKSGVHMMKDNWRRAAQGLNLLPAKQVLVGVPAEKTGRNDGPFTNADIGYIMEHGAPEANIPARPHVAPGILNEQKAIEKFLLQAANYGMELDKDGIERALHAAGLAGVRGIQRKITTGPFQSLAPGTLAARRRRGRTGTKPLLDTGQYRRSITHVIRAAPSGRLR